MTFFIFRIQRAGAILCCLYGLLAGFESHAASPKRFEFFQPLKPSRPYQMMAHRGMATQAPENTAAAIEESIAQCVEWVEVDVRLSSDGHHILFHDSKLDSKTDGKGPVREKTLKELKALDAGGWFAKRFAGTRLLTLAEGLALAHNRCNLYLDYKDANVSLLVSEILEARMESQVVVYAPTNIIAHVSRLSGGRIATMTKWRPEYGMEAWITAVKPSAVEIDAPDISAERVEAMHEKGIYVEAKALDDWDKPEVWSRLAKAGVDWFQTDFPDEVQALLYWIQTTNHPILISCHRGANSLAPENTLPAFDKAARLGVDYVEFDVRTSLDGRLFLLHDSKLDRTTNGKGPLKNLSSNDLDKLDAGSWFGKPFTRIPLPRLEEFLRHCDKRLKLYLDAKDIAPEALARIVTSNQLEGRVVVYNHADYLRTLKGLAPTIRRMPGLSQAKDLPKLAAEVAPYFVDVDWSALSKDLVQACHEKGIKVTSDALDSHETAQDYIRAIEMGIDMIQTDYPLRVIEACRQTQLKR